MLDSDGSSSLDVIVATLRPPEPCLLLAVKCRLVIRGEHFTYVITSTSESLWQKACYISKVMGPPIGWQYEYNVIQNVYFVGRYILVAVEVIRFIISDCSSRHLILYENIYTTKYIYIRTQFYWTVNKTKSYPTK